MDSSAMGESSNKCPACILIFSGKRKTGKDHITDILFNRCSSEAVKVHLSLPIKSHWAKTEGLDLNELLGSGDYKEQHRQKMNAWGETMRRQDPGYFCKLALQMCEAIHKKIWIITDARRLSDLCWFRDNYGGGDKIRTVRVNATEEMRCRRGWVFTSGVDDAETECNLDSVTNWDWILDNNANENVLEPKLKEILDWIHLKLSCG